MPSIEIGAKRLRGSGAGSSSELSPIPQSPRSLNRQAKLHRLLKQLHSQAEVGEQAAAADAAAMPPPPPPPPGATGRRTSSRGQGEGEAGGEAGGSSSDAPAASSSDPPPEKPRSHKKQAPSLQVDVQQANARDDAGGGAGASGRGRGRGIGSGRGRGGRGGPPTPNFRKGQGGKMKADHSAANGDSDKGPELNPPLCIFKKHVFTGDPPPETRYDFSQVPRCTDDLTGSSLLRPSSRRQWFACIQELESLAQESLDRRAARLQMNTPSGLPLVYIADRMDIDDPLWGYQIRGEGSGWLQGFITCTVFTTWTHYFEWNSMHAASGMAAARVANSMIGQEDPYLCSSEGGETVHQVAVRVGVKPADLVRWNLSRFPQISINSRVQPGTSFFVADPTNIDVVTVDKPGDTPKKLAQRLGVSCDDLVELNSVRQPQLQPGTKLKPGTELVYRDRSAEPEVFLPTGKQERALDEDGSIASELNMQHHEGDPTTTGVVWPKVAEIGLVAGLGAGKMLVRLALEELRASGEFDFVVLQATSASVSFYEELGFVRVGAVAKYHPEGTNLEQNPVQGYRHWACADESRVDDFGDTSYMMALKLQTLAADKELTKQLTKRLVSDWPSVTSAGGAGKSPGKRKSANGFKAGHNHAGILQPKGSELQVRRLDHSTPCRAAAVEGLHHP